MRKKGKVSRLNRSERRAGMLFIAPIYLQFTVFFLFFLGYAVVMSMTNWNILYDTRDFVGLNNFITVLTDPLFWRSMWNTLFLMLGIPIGMVLAMLAALALNRKLVGKTVYRVILYLPAVSSTVAIALLWRMIFNAETGVINLLIQQVCQGVADLINAVNAGNVDWLTQLAVTLDEVQGPRWLNDPVMLKITLIILGVWRGAGNTMLLFLAGLQNIPKEYYEVMDVSGGNAWHKLRYVTLPMMSPTYFYVIITGVIGGLQAFGDQFIIAPGNYDSMTVVYYLWEQGMTNYNMGMACAVALILSAIIFVVTLIQFKVSKNWVYDGSH